MAKITYLRDSEQDGKAQLYIDGEVLESSSFRTDVADNIHAIQWNGSTGEVEYNDGTNNATISDISSYDFETRFKTKLKAITDAEATAIKNRTYDVKRTMEYPPISEQLDEIYHNGIDGWKNTIKAVKDKYPK